METQEGMTMVQNKISVIGLGYIGLPTAVLLARAGHTVDGVDVSPHVVESVNAGHLHLVEPGLQPVLKAVVDSGNFYATSAPEAADAFILSVPTPFTGEQHHPDLSYIEVAAKSIAPVLQKGNLVILESTSPAGTTEQLAEWLAAQRSDLTFPQQTGENADIQLAHCPERVLPGKVLQELVANDRVIGGLTPRAAVMAKELYQTFVKGDIALTTARTAEMCKLAENSFRDVNIAFANELSLICDKLDIDVWELIRLANRHPRVNILQPGCGVGGHCIAVDPWFVVDSVPEEARLIRTAREVNDSKPHKILEKIKAAVAKGKNPQNAVVACLGLAFKPDIDDLRESPAVQITAMLVKAGYHVLAVEPNIKTLPANLEKAGHITLVSLDQALQEADVVCVLVKHKEFLTAKDRIQQINYLIDTVNL